MASSKPARKPDSARLLQRALTTALARVPAPPQRIAVALSGGMDSMALLHVANMPAFNATPLIALHVDHGIHPASAQWAARCADVAASLGVEFASVRLDGLASGQANLEENARQARWAALARLARRAGADLILTAHHAQDQAETVLLHLLRGTGLAGLGMSAQGDWHGVPVLRPWLAVPRSVIEQYSRAAGLQWIEDPSNQDTSLRRNAVRLQLWPALEAVDERALPSLLRFAALANESEALLDWFAQRELAPLLAADGQSLRWTPFSALPGAVQCQLFRVWCTQLGIRAPSRDRLLAMLQQLAGDSAYGLRCSHAGWQFWRQRGVVNAVRAKTSVD